MSHKCWARQLGGCRGGISREHIFSKGIFQGDDLQVDGAPWFHGASKQIPLDQAVANVLCSHHNNKLGEYADQAAIAIRDAIQESINTKAEGGGWVSNKAGIFHPRQERMVDGPSLGAWLAKTHCNVRAISRKAPSPTYVRYAFTRQQTAEAPVYFYHPHQLGETVQFGYRPHVQYVEYIEEPDMGGEPFAIHICGFWTLVALRPMPQAIDFLERPNAFKYASLTLRLDWTDDPPLDRPPGAEATLETTRDE